MIIGIDLGTTNSLAAVWKDGKSRLIPNSVGEFLTPSVVSLDDDGSILVGKAAVERLVSRPDRSASGFKRFMGTDRRFILGGKAFLPEELSSFLLRRIVEDASLYLDEEVTEAVISVPAYFNDRQRSAAKRAGQLAGIKVERLVNEPSAAALACRLASGEDETSSLVFDFGGGTLDVSMVDCFDNVVSIAAVSGDNQLGGDDFNQIIAEAFCQENQLDFSLLSPVQRAILLRQAEQCKMALGRQETVGMLLSVDGVEGTFTLSNNKLIELAAPMFRRMAVPIRRVLTDSEMTVCSIDQVVLVGGSCKMPIVRQYITHLLGQEPVRAGSPDTVVALGAGAYAGMKARCPDIRDMLLTDICPFTLGTGVHNFSDPGNNLMEPIIERNSVLPTSKVKRFFTVNDAQKRMNIEICQGEGRHCADNLKLGEVNVEIPPAPKGQASVDVRFTYDINGILEVEVTNCATGETERALIIGRDTGMTAEEAQERLEELSGLKLHPRDQEENRVLLAQGERLYQETLGSTRENVGQILDWFQRILTTQENIQIAHARKRVKEFFDNVENGIESFGTFYIDPDDEDEEF